MAKDNKLYKALESIALGYSRGDASIDMLIKACDSYKNRIGFDDGYQYQLCVSKSLADKLNGVEPTEEIEKGIVPGQTKVLNGVMYIYSPTAPGSAKPYDWHVVQQGAKTKANIGGGGKLDAKAIAASNKWVNDLFPDDPSKLKEVNKPIGGSTGAKLMEDGKGNRYVVKRGSNTNNDHVTNEYLATQLYSIMGFNAPYTELYDDKGMPVYVSKFIPQTDEPQPKDYPLMAQGWIADVLLANRDAYENDNIRISASGKAYRVDNGATMEFRARGDKKPFTADILTDYKGMCKYNPMVFATLTDKDIRAQIAAIQAKKDDILLFLKESGKDKLAAVMEKRIDNLKDIIAELDNNKSITEIPIKPRKLKPAKEMYRELDVKEMNTLYQSISGSSVMQKVLSQTEGVGWELLDGIAKMRGFDARPQVVTNDEYWKAITADPSRQFFRGLNESGGMKSDDMVKSLLFDDKCFWGTVGVYGEGIYAHKNDGSRDSSHDEVKYQQSDAWKHAHNYATHHGADKGVIVKGYIAPDAKIGDYKTLQQELENLTISNTDPAKYAALQGEITGLAKDISELDVKIRDTAKTVVEDAYKKANFDKDAYAMMSAEIEDVDWGALNAFGERDIPTFKDFVEGKMVKWVKEQGGVAKVGRGTVSFMLPHSREELVVSKMQYDSEFAVKQNNVVAPYYHYSVAKFEDWMNRNHVRPAEEAAEEARSQSSQIVSQLTNERSRKEAALRQKESERVALENGDDMKEILPALKRYGDDEAVGVYAAIKGYDVVEVNLKGNGHRSNDNNFYVILNRSKLVVSNKVDYV